MPHIHELIDFTVGVFIVHKNKVLLVHHKKLNLWLSIGGHIELDEDPDQALFREVKEECGLKIKVIGDRPKKFSDRKQLYAPAFVDIHQIDKKHRHVVLIYFAKSKSDKFKHNKDEHNEIRWFAKKDLSDPKFKILPGIKFYAREALKKAAP